MNVICQRPLAAFLPAVIRCLALVGLGWASLPPTTAQTFRLLHTFDYGREGVRPQEPLIQGTDGRLYGTTRSGGRADQGTVFAMNPDGSGFVVLHHFNFVGDAAKDGYTPAAGLCQASDGRLYGTTYSGGANWGTIFTLRSDGTDFRVMRQFNTAPYVNSDGSAPEAALMQASDGRLYGTTWSGGTGTRGVIFAINLFNPLNPTDTGYTILRQLNSTVDGGRPMGSLIEGSDGYLYGTASEYGPGNSGTVFALTKSGAPFPGTSTNFIVLRALTGATDGTSPRAGLREGSDGRLYGTTWTGGTQNAGTIFTLPRVGNTLPDGTTFSVLHHFGFQTNGGWCASQLVEGSDGRLYGTTDIGGAGNAGVIFAIDKGGDNSGLGYTVLRRSDANGAIDGARSGSGLLKAADGKLYGVFSDGGTDPASAKYYGYGTIYRISEDGSGFAVLRAMNHWGDGRMPRGKPLFARDGRIYGATNESANGGTGGPGFSNGTIYVMNRDGSGFTVLHEFPYAGPWGGTTYPGASGWNPNGDLIEGTDGKLYGTTSAGGSVYGRGEVFRINCDGSGFTVLTGGFPGNEIGIPWAGVVEGSDGKLYGTHSSGGAGSAGGIYSLNKDGTGYTILREFTSATEGGAPKSQLVRGSDGRLYGTNPSGGLSGGGTLFAFNEGGGGFVVLHHFNPSTDGYTVNAGLIVGPDGTLYGTASSGGSGNGGTVFSLRPGATANDSEFHVLYAFSSIGFYQPAGGVAFGGDGRLYGVAGSGGVKGAGAFYALKLNAGSIEFSPVHEIDRDVDGHGTAGVANTFDVAGGPDGAVYALARYAGAYSAGTAVALGFPPVITSALAASGTYAQPFSYSIVASHRPMDYDAFPLPSALTIDHPTGVISGTASQAGAFTVNLAATNPFGIGLAELALNIAKADATVTITDTQHTFDGTPKQVTVTTNPAGLGATVTYNGSTTAPSAVGSYDVVATINDLNYQGTGTAVMTIASSSTTTAVQITTQPANVTATVGQTAAFTVVATGSAPLYYQWRKNNKDMVGATSDTLTINNVQGSDADRYRVIVSNSVSTATSSWATLTVLQPPVITEQPQSQTVVSGRSATFTVKATGTTPLTYQWFKNNQPLAGQTSNRLQLQKVTTADAGTYTVTVSNAGGVATSAPAILTVQ